MDRKNLDNISKLCLGIAGLFFLFSFVAPMLLTNDNLYFGIDFTNTAPVGDTIGGIMSPFIAIVGVLLTFLAFYMQVKANNLQREQFIKSLSKGTIDEKIDSYYKLDILKLDIENTIKDIQNRLKQLKKWKTTLSKDPFYALPMHRATLKHYDRVATLERLSIYKGFKYFVSEVDVFWIETFNKMYNLIDYIPEAIKDLYRITDHHNDDIYKQKLAIRKQLRELEKQCVNYINDENINATVKNNIRLYFQKYQSELRKSEIDSTETNLTLIKEELEKLAGTIRSYLEQSEDKEITDIHNNHIARILYDMNFVIAQSNHLLSELDIIVENFEGQDEVLVRLNNLIDILINSLDRTNPESIEKSLLGD